MLHATIYSKWYKIWRNNCFSGQMVSLKKVIVCSRALDWYLFCSLQYSKNSKILFCGIQVFRFLETSTISEVTRNCGPVITKFPVLRRILKKPSVMMGRFLLYHPQRYNLCNEGDELTGRRIIEKACSDAERQAGDVRLLECFGGIVDLDFREQEEGLNPLFLGNRKLVCRGWEGAFSAGLCRCLAIWGEKRVISLRLRICH